MPFKLSVNAQSNCQKKSAKEQTFSDKDIKWVAKGEGGVSQRGLWKANRVTAYAPDRTNRKTISCCARVPRCSAASAATQI